MTMSAATQQTHSLRSLLFASPDSHSQIGHFLIVTRNLALLASMLLKCSKYNPSKSLPSEPQIPPSSPPSTSPYYAPSLLNTISSLHTRHSHSRYETNGTETIISFFTDIHLELQLTIKTPKPQNSIFVALLSAALSNPPLECCSHLSYEVNGTETSFVSSHTSI